jgi:hypothetical protein
MPPSATSLRLLLADRLRSELIWWPCDDAVELDFLCRLDGLNDLGDVDAASDKLFRDAGAGAGAAGKLVEAAPLPVLLERLPMACRFAKRLFDRDCLLALRQS